MNLLIFNALSWEQRKVQDIYKITRGYVLAAPETDENSSDDMPYPVYSSQTKNNGLMGYYKDYLYEDAITWTTDGANAGTVNYRAGKFYCTNVCGVLLSDEGYANKCAAEALNNVAWKWVSHVGNPKLMNNVMGEIPISLPRSIEEQDQISKFFEEIDNLITLHQSKAESWKNKKNQLSTIYWEQRKLSEVTTEFKSGEGIKADEIEENGTYPVYGGNGLRGYTERYNHDGEYALIGRQGALCGNMNYSVGKAYFTEHAVAVKANESNDTRFLYYLLDRMDLGRYSDQSAQPGLAVNKLVVLHTYVPRKQEQEAIGVYFKSLDHLITLHQRKLNRTQICINRSFLYGSF